MISCSKINSKLSPAPSPLGTQLAAKPRCCLSIFVWQVKSFSFAIFSAGSQWTARLEKPQHRQSSSPPLSSHSWNPLLLNNEPNLSSASRGGVYGGPQSHPQLSARLCCPYVRAGTHKHILTNSHSLSVFATTSSLVRNALLIGSKGKKKKQRGAELGDIERSWRFQRGVGR